MNPWMIIQGEVANLYLSLISGYLVLSLLIYLAVKLGTPQRFRANMMLMRVRLAKGMFVSYIAIGLLSWWALVRGYGERHGYNVDWMSAHWIPIVLKIALAIGMLCIARLLQPERWGQWAWVAPVVIGTACAVVAWLSFVG